MVRGWVEGSWGGGKVRRGDRRTKNQARVGDVHEAASVCVGRHSYLLRSKGSGLAVVSDGLGCDEGLKVRRRWDFL